MIRNIVARTVTVPHSSLTDTLLIEEAIHDCDTQERTNFNFNSLSAITNNDNVSCMAVIHIHRMCTTQCE